VETSGLKGMSSSIVLLFCNMATVITHLKNFYMEL
jgi:hypothetical protein